MLFICLKYQLEFSQKGLQIQHKKICGLFLFYILRFISNTSFNIKQKFRLKLKLLWGKHKKLNFCSLKKLQYQCFFFLLKKFNQLTNFIAPKAWLILLCLNSVRRINNFFQLYFYMSCTTKNKNTQNKVSYSCCSRLLLQTIVICF